MKFDKATIYRLGGFMGVSKIEVKEGELTFGQYAQYPRAAKVVFKRPRARKMLGFTEPPDTDGPSIRLVILKGWGHMDPDGIYHDAKKETLESGAEITTREGRYSMCDPRWWEDFSGQIANYLRPEGDHPYHKVVLYDGRAELATN